ncbi:MAG TPA: hypothetical protein VGG19_16325 [Tepidisphaeraceae bacterium]
MSLPDPSMVKVALIAAATLEVCVGWVPLVIARHRGAKLTWLIALCGFLTAPVPLLVGGAVFWSLLAPTKVAQGPGFPVEQK